MMNGSVTKLTVRRSWSLPKLMAAAFAAGFIMGAVLL